MNGFQTDREDIAAKLSANGVSSVTLDPRGDTPCVLVDLPEIVATVGVGGYQVEQSIKVIANPPGDQDALAWLLDQLELVLALYPGPARPSTVERNGKEHPAYTLTTTRRVASLNC